MEAVEEMLRAKVKENDDLQRDLDDMRHQLEGRAAELSEIQAERSAERGALDRITPELESAKGEVTQR